MILFYRLRNKVLDLALGQVENRGGTADSSSPSPIVGDGLFVVRSFGAFSKMSQRIIRCQPFRLCGDEEVVVGGDKSEWGTILIGE